MKDQLYQSDQKAKEEIARVMLRKFRVNDQPIELSPNQFKLFVLVLFKEYPRNIIIMPTQYGKSFVIALAIICRAAFSGDRFTILAPSEKKAGIIMSYVIEHSFDHPSVQSKLELDANVSLDRLRRERSRTNLTYIGGGGIMVLSLDARNGKRNVEAAMGFGGQNLILDESSLINDTLYASTKRMLGGYSSGNTFLLEIGNPFYRNHFYRTWYYNDNYNKHFVDYEIALSEGRFSHEFIDEMRGEPLFDVFYECKFPAEDMIDAKGFRALITTEEIEARFVDRIGYKKPEKDKSGKWIKNANLKLGVDIGGGGDRNVFVIRNQQYAWVEATNQTHDTMANVVEVERIMEKYPELDETEIYIDDIGIGRGVSDRLIEKGLFINGVAFGENAQDTTKFKNIRAEVYWNAAQWAKNKGYLFRDTNLLQLTWTKYKISTDKVIQMEPKEDVRRRTGYSPDYADALALTFTNKPAIPDIAFL